MWSDKELMSADFDLSYSLTQPHTFGKYVSWPDLEITVTVEGESRSIYIDLKAVSKAIDAAKEMQEEIQNGVDRRGD